MNPQYFNFDPDNACLNNFTLQLTGSTDGTMLIIGREYIDPGDADIGPTPIDNKLYTSTTINIGTPNPIAVFGEGEVVHTSLSSSVWYNLLNDVDDNYTGATGINLFVQNLGQPPVTVICGGRTYQFQAYIKDPDNGDYINILNGDFDDGGNC